jgi:hypothetical protein
MGDGDPFPKDKPLDKMISMQSFPSVNCMIPSIRDFLRYTLLVLLTTSWTSRHPLSRRRKVRRWIRPRAISASAESASGWDTE